jgi:hypothetical protein
MDYCEIVSESISESDAERMDGWIEGNAEGIDGCIGGGIVPIKLSGRLLLKLKIVEYANALIELL